MSHEWENCKSKWSVSNKWHGDVIAILAISVFNRALFQASGCRAAPKVLQTKGPTQCERLEHVERQIHAIVAGVVQRVARTHPDTCSPTPQVPLDRKDIRYIRLPPTPLRELWRQRRRSCERKESGLDMR